MSISFRNYAIANLDVVGVSGQPALWGALLRFTAQYTCSPIYESWPQISARATEARLYCGRAHLDSTFLCYAKAELPLNLKPEKYPSPRGILFDAALSPSQLAAIDSLPGRGDLQFSLKIAFESTDGIDYEQKSDALSYSCNQAQWAKLMLECGDPRALLLTLPLNGKIVGSHFSEASKKLATANDAFRECRYDDAVSGCRLVAESIQHVKKFAIDSSELVANESKNKKSLSKGERMQQIHKPSLTLPIWLTIQIQVESTNRLVGQTPLFA